jgi:hypothetical protein
VIVVPVSLPVQPALEQITPQAALPNASYGLAQLHWSAGTFPVIQLPADAPQDKPAETQPDEPTQQPAAGAPAQDQNKDAAKDPAKDPSQAGTQQTFWERVFRMPPLRTRLEKALAQDWKLTDIRPRHLDYLVSLEGEEVRAFFLSGLNARQYHRLVKEYGIGVEVRNNRVVDETFDTLSDYGPELISKYPTLMEHRALIKRYYAGVFRDGRISTQALIRISNSIWFGPFGPPRFRQAARILDTRFKVPDHVIGPMLSSVGDSFWLQRVLVRKTAPDEFKQLLDKIAPSAENSGNAFAPALQLLVVGEEHKIAFPILAAFVADLQLKPQDFGPFSAIIYSLGVYRLANEIKCPTFAQFLRRELDEFGPGINQESALFFLLSFREFKDNAEALTSFLSPQYNETKAFLRTIGVPIASTVWNMERIAFLAATLTPAKRTKITELVRALSEELKVADIMFLNEIAENEEECKLLLNRPALLDAVKEIKIDRIVERRHNDLVKELEREIDIANRNGLMRTVRRLTNLLKEEKRAYTERVEPSQLSNVQLSRLLIFHRSLDMPGFMDTIGWNVSLDLQNERSEGGGYLGYDKDMAMVTIVPGQPGDNRQYRPIHLSRAPASLALFHNHAFRDSFTERYMGFMSWLFSPKRRKADYAGPSGWVGAMKGDITAAAESELPSFIITKIGYPTEKDGLMDKKKLLVNLDWVIVDRESGEALRSDRGVFTVPFFGDEQLGKLKWPSRKEMRRRERENREKCPPVTRQAAEVRAQ